MRKQIFTRKSVNFLVWNEIVFVNFERGKCGVVDLRRQEVRYKNSFTNFFQFKCGGGLFTERNFVTGLLR